MPRLMAIALLLILFSLISSVSASIGSISEISGSGAIERDNDIIDGKVGVSVESYDVAVTANGRMRIDFRDQTRVDVTEHSRLIIDEFVYDPAQNQGSIGLKASLGTVKYASGQIAKKHQQNIKIQTPSATIGVRGTDFAMMVDEIGGSTITLLPSCRHSHPKAALECYVGEITVETDAGMVIMNQAFQTTVVDTSNNPPSRPLVLDIDPSQLNNMLIVRQESEYELTAQELQEQADVLDVDYLEFDELDEDSLQESIDGIWRTDLGETENILEVNIFDLMQNIRNNVDSALANELDNQYVFGDRPEGLDEKTGIYYEAPPPEFVVRRQDETGNVFEFRLSESHGYSIDILQGTFIKYDYQTGIGTNRIRVDQSR